MFEAIDARAYKNLRGDIKALIDEIIYKMVLENGKTVSYIDRKQYEAAEYHSGRVSAFDDISTRLINIIYAIDSERNDEIIAEEEKITDWLDSEIASDESRSKQS